MDSRVQLFPDDGALWVLQPMAILYEPAHEITALVRLPCNEGSDEPLKMRMKLTFHMRQIQ